MGSRCRQQQDRPLAPRLLLTRLHPPARHPPPPPPPFLQAIVGNASAVEALQLAAARHANASSASSLDGRPRPGAAQAWRPAATRHS